MVEIPANQISFYDLETKFGLTEVKDDLFLAYLNELPDPQDKQSLERIQRNYSNLSKRRPMLEDLVKNDGREFVFIKLIQNNLPQYARSDALTIERDQEFYSVFKMLKYLKEIEN